MISGEPTNTFLVHFSGPDKPGLTAAITRILVKHGVRILDIGQAVVHENLGLGFLLAVDPGEFPTLRNELHDRADELGLVAQLTPVSAEALKHWMLGMHQHHFIVTVLGRAIGADHLARLSETITAQGMNIDRVERLSGNLSPDDASGNACIELGVSGDASREGKLRAEFLRVAQELSIDIAFQRESIFRRNRRLFAIDMDSTLIQGEVIDELAKMAGVGERVTKITESAMRGEIDFDESFTRRVGLL